MVRVKMLLGTKVCIIDNQACYVFDAGGNCIEEGSGLIPMYSNGALPLPVVSILSDGDNVEIALFVDDVMEVLFNGSMPIMNAIMRVQGCGRFLRMLNRRGKHDGVSFNQTLFVYTEGSEVVDKLKETFKNG